MANTGCRWHGHLIVEAHRIIVHDHQDDGHGTTVGMHINALKTKLMFAFIPGEQRQAVLLANGPSEDVDGFKCLGSIFIVKGHGIWTVRRRIILADQHSLACYYFFVSVVKYRCVQKRRSAKQRCLRLCSAVVKRGQLLNNNYTKFFKMIVIL